MTAAPASGTSSYGTLDDEEVRDAMACVAVGLATKVNAAMSGIFAVTAKRGATIPIVSELARWWPSRPRWR